MAQIIFYKSPIDIREKSVFKTDHNTIGKILKELEIENEPLAVRINGKSPDDVDLDSEINSNDKIEIARVVNSRRGGGGSKRALGTFFQILAVVVLFAVPGPIGIGLSIGFNLAAGYLQTKAAEIAAKNAAQPKSEADVQNNNFTPLNASNELRPNQPMSLPFGSIKLAPEFHTVPVIGLDNLGSPPSEGARKRYEHVFNIGLGDIFTSEKQIFGIPLANIYPLPVDFEIDKGPNWNFPVFNEVKIISKPIQEKTLDNPNLTGSAIALNDLNPYNFCFVDTPVSHSAILLVFEVICYFGSDTGIQSNSFILEVQYKTKNDTNYQASETLSYSNANTQRQMTRRVYLDPPTSSDDRIQLRVRKRSQDSSDNAGQRIAQLKTFGFSYKDETLLERRGLILETLMTYEGPAQSSSSDKYTLLVEHKCWVWNFGTEQWEWTFTRNPAWLFKYFANGMFLCDRITNPLLDTYPNTQLYWLNTNPEHPNNIEKMFGAGLTDAQIDIEKIKEWAQFCDDNNLSFDYVLREDISCAEMLEKIANTGRGYTTYYNGLLGVTWEESGQTPVGLYGMGNILAGTFSVSYSVSDQVSKITASYIDRDANWELREVEADVPYAASDNYRFIKITLDGITERQQAQREVNILAARQFYQRRTYTWKVDFEGLIAKRGDVVYLSHDATQYGYSGRITKFNVVGGIVTSIETTSTLEDSTINHVTIRYPDGNLAIYECTVSDNVINFVDTYPLNKAPVFIDTETDNNSSDYTNSMPDDFIFIAGAKETPGKIVRITEIKSEEDLTFTISAVDEDPAMWSYEFNDLYMTPPIDESFDDSEIVCKIDNLQYFNLGNGLVKIMWENLNSHYIKIVNNDTELPIEADGSFAFSGGEVILELDPGYKYNLRIEPFVVGTPYRQENKVITVWA